MGAMKPAGLSAPEKLSPEHDLAAFDSGERVLDEWLRRRAARNESSGGSRTYVICAGKRVVGYYSLAVGATTHEQVPGRIKRNMPDPVPVMILGRLAVDKAFQGKGLGAGLLKDAVLRTMQAGEIAGIRALLVHAISDAAKRFYEAYGFIASPVEDRHSTGLFFAGFWALARPHSRTTPDGNNAQRFTGPPPPHYP